MNSQITDVLAFLDQLPKEGALMSSSLERLGILNQTLKMPMARHTPSAFLFQLKADA